MLQVGHGLPKPHWKNTWSTPKGTRQRASEEPRASPSIASPEAPLLKCAGPRTEELAKAVVPNVIHCSTMPPTHRSQSTCLQGKTGIPASQDPAKFGS